jgi:hypothetical protein
MQPPAILCILLRMDSSRQTQARTHISSTLLMSARMMGGLSHRDLCQFYHPMSPPVIACHLCQHHSTHSAGTFPQDPQVLS